MIPESPARTPRHVFYLHGFASSAQSKKAAYFGERLRAHGLVLRTPDFNQPSFETLTMTRMLEQTTAAIQDLEPGPIALIGSSLGAVVAIHMAGRMPDRISRLVLLAPALTFARDGHSFLGQDRLARWKANGSLDVFHFGYGGTRPLHYTFYEDSLKYDVLEVGVRQPVLIFQGLRDEAVDHRAVEKYAATRPNVTLALLDDDHQLMASLSRIWDDMAPFFGLA
ncbi:MAG: YqiA/YcfP family alpha/beta fold hydrolase [Betaproteobacteria bacterium]|jgi:pimeloyl-ACP methyl ester carboxylesterase